MGVRFSILIPVYNRFEYLRETLDSVLSQSFLDYEVFVIDDGSTEPLPRWLESYKSSRFKTLRQSNQGPGGARDHAARLSQGEYFCMLDSDDLLLPHALAIYDATIRHFDSPPLVLGSMRFFRDNDRVIEIVQSPREISLLRYTNFLSKAVPAFISNSRIVVRKSTFHDVGEYCNGGHALFPAEDYDLILRASTKCPCIILQQPPTIARREHASNLSGNLGRVAEGIVKLAARERAGGYPGGKKFEMKRYAVIGGFSFGWATRHCWPAKQRRVALSLLYRTAPMVAAAIWNRFARLFHQRVKPIILSLPAERGGFHDEQAFRRRSS